MLDANLLPPAMESACHCKNLTLKLLLGMFMKIENYLQGLT